MKEWSVSDRMIDTGLEGAVNQRLLHAVLGQLSDGKWQNSPRMEPYWLCADIINDNNHIFIRICGKSWISYCGRSYPNLYADMSDDKVKLFFATKIKQLIKDEFEGNKNAWKRNNETESDYLNNTKICDAYYAYDVLKGRNTSNKVYSKVDTVFESLMSNFKSDEVINEEIKSDGLTISEVIKRLYIIKQKRGDLLVNVQYRDDGGDYSGQDSTLRFEINNDSVTL